ALARVEMDAFERRVEMTYWGMGAEWADSLGADVISSSLGYSRFDDPDTDYTYRDMDGHTTDVSRFAEIAASKGILVVNAAGNEGWTPWRHLIAPADVDGDSLIAVGAVDAAGTIAGFSSRGPSPFVARAGPVSVEFGLEGSTAAAGGRLRVLDVQARMVRELWSGSLEPARPLRASWDGADGDGREAPPGLYWIALGVAGRLAAARLVLIR